MDPFSNDIKFDNVQCMKIICTSFYEISQNWNYCYLQLYYSNVKMISRCVYKNPCAFIFYNTKVIYVFSRNRNVKRNVMYVYV